MFFSPDVQNTGKSGTGPRRSREPGRRAPPASACPASKNRSISASSASATTSMSASRAACAGACSASGTAVFGHLARVVGGERVRLHADEIDDAGELRLFADRHLHRHAGAVQGGAHRLERARRGSRDRGRGGCRR